MTAASVVASRWNLEGEQGGDGYAQNRPADEQRHHEHLPLNGEVSRWFHDSRYDRVL
jgi:hypothetical protein